MMGDVKGRTSVDQRVAACHHDESGWGGLPALGHRPERTREKIRSRGISVAKPWCRSPSMRQRVIACSREQKAS